MAVSMPAALPQLRWPTLEVDPSRADVDYDVPADELTLFFGGAPVAAIAAPMAVFGGRIAVLFDELSGEIVGIQGMPFLLEAVKYQPSWAAVAWALLAGELGPETLRRALPDLIQDVAGAFDRYGVEGKPTAD